VSFDVGDMNRELQEFAHAASHDPKEPPRKIRTYCQLISSRYAGDLVEEAQGFFKSMQQTANRMSAVLDSLRCYCKAAG